MDDRLRSYAETLARNGFEVYLTPFGHGYLTYQLGGFWGTFQYSEFEGWQHYMELTPSREFGSCMHIDGDHQGDPWTVEAARECAQAFNRNDVVGTQPNAGKAWLSNSAERIA